MIVDSPGAVRRRVVGDLLVRKLAGTIALGAGPRRALRGLPATLTRYHRQQEIVAAGASPERLMMIFEGAAARMKPTRAGGDRMTALLLPGDVFDWPLLSLRLSEGDRENAVLHHAIVAITSTVVAEFRTDAVLAALEEWPMVRRALDASALVEREIAQEWVSGLSARSAVERLAHLLCEYFQRMRLVGLTDRNDCPFPLSRARFGHAQGLSTVYTSRLLGQLERDGLARIERRTLTILDPAGLEAFADFTPTYLTLSGRAGGSTGIRAAPAVLHHAQPTSP